MKGSGKRSRRGEPLYFLAAVLLGWTAARTITLVGFAPAQALPSTSDLAVRGAVATPGVPSQQVGAQVPAPAYPLTRSAALARLDAKIPAHVFGGSMRPVVLSSGSLSTMSSAVSHDEPKLAATPDAVDPFLEANHTVAPRSLPAPLARRGSHWSGDGWLLYRRGSGAPAAAAGLFPTYGASQAGGVIRYALAPSSSRAPQAYLRASRALDFAQSEAAVGLSLRPLPGIPARLLGEARVQRDGGRTRLRPAAAVVSELPPVRLPLGAQGELYAQAGYVGGKNATPYFDAQATIERPLLATGPAELRLGAGAWAGGQEGSARLDLGPRASVKLAFGEASSRLALDWRFRVAGNARPGSGPAVTFSAGF